MSDHQANGTTILRTGKVVKNCGDEHGMWNYAKLAYCTKYPWEASPSLNTGAGFESQQYVLLDNTDGTLEKCNVTLWYGEREGVLYRRQFFNYTLERECMWMQAVNLADFTVPYGLIRVDKMRLFRRPVTLTLGAWGFPDHGTECIRKSDGMAQAFILKGKDSCGREKQLAMTIYDGWEEICMERCTGSNPESGHSILLYAKTHRKKQYGGAEPYVLISQVLTKESLVDFSKEELFPIFQISYLDKMCVGAYGKIRVSFKNGSEKIIDFTGMEGRLML